MSPLKGIPQETIEEIKQKTDIVDLVEEYVNLKKKSAQNYFGLCPFHTEKTPSFSVSPHKQIYYCFGCQKGGDVIGFLMEIEKLGYPDAVRMLAERANVTIRETDDRAYRERTEKNNKIYDANTEAARYFYKNLMSEKGRHAKKYLTDRGIAYKTINKFGLGYALEQWEGLLGHLRSKGYEDEIIFKTGLFKKRDGSEGMYDLMRNRIMFPIFDYLGRVVAFGGRVLDDSMPKYINSPETDVYTKGKHLYAYQLAKHTKRDRNIVVEGYFDAIAIHQAGLDNAVASLGTALTTYQASLLTKHSKEVVIAYDADTAGQAATMRGLDILNKKNCKIYVLTLPEGKDPDDYIKKNGAERFEALVKKALPYIEYKLEVAHSKSLLQGELDPVAYQELVCDILAKEDNEIIRELYAEKVANLIGTSMHAVMDEIERQVRSKDKNRGEYTYKMHSRNIKKQDSANLVDEEEFKASREEIHLFSLLAENSDVIDNKSVSLEPDYFSKGVMRNLAQALNNIGENEEFNTSKLISMVGEEKVNGKNLSEIFAESCMNTQEMKQPDEALTEATRLYTKIKIKHYFEEKERINEKLKDSEITQEKEKLKHKLNEVTRRIIELKNEINKY